MAKQYFLRFTEARRDLLISSSSEMVIRMSFSEGPAGTGHARKRDALRRAAMINAAAGKEIAIYDGAKG